ncbi:MAG: Type II secretion system protein E [Porticoccaceae bacterium UBA1117]|nr:MAG: Type II secretion system protein E [Porticoccaceae bacterium UBA1117]
MSLEAALADHGVSVEDIEKGLAYQAKAGGALEKILLNMGSFSEELLPSVYSQYLMSPILAEEQRDSWVAPKVEANLPHSFFLDNGWVLFDSPKLDKYTFVTKAPLNWDVLQYLNNEDISFCCIISSESDFGILSLKIVETASPEIKTGNVLSDIEESRLRELASEAPTVNLLNSLITKALRMRASDMHVEPVGDRYRVRYRIDGVLQDIDQLPERLQLLIISRLKILSGMDIAEKRRPQDGKIEMRVSNISLDIRVSSLPVNKGESMVLRFLRKDSVTYNMESLGLAPDTFAAINEDLKRTSGVILMTGPTGSGKTTTLYTFLNQLNGQDVKIITLEDPVEYQLAGLNQVHVRPEIGFDFSAGLRSVVRQDPDVIMVGEIRDKETCQIAMQAALTGHLVFSTVHTNDAASAFTRLLDLGVEEFLLNAALVSIMAQRLARKLCDHCSVPVSNSEELFTEYNLAPVAKQLAVEKWTLMDAVGCDQCGHTGFKGRLAIIEYLRCDEHLRSIPKDDQFLSNAKNYNRSQGGRDLVEDGLLKVFQGQTTIEEVYRVCG